MNEPRPHAGEQPFSAVDHIGYVVADLDAASAFFVDLLGFETLPRRGASLDADGERTAAWLGVDPRASYRFAFFALGSTTVELLEWTAPDQDQKSPRNSDRGGRHLALRTSDLDAMVARLSAVPGVTIRDRHDRGFVYVATPFGLELQLVPG